MFTLTWAAGFAAAMIAIFICRAERRYAGHGGTAFDKPLRRMLAYGLAGASLGLLIFYAMLGDGVVYPLVTLAAMAAALWCAPDRRAAAWGGLAMILALIAFACVIAAFQQVYGDYFFGFDDPFAR